jgi:hypothetical protein
MKVPTWPTLSLMITLVVILEKCPGYFVSPKKTKRKKTSTHQKNWSGVERWRRRGVAFFKSWLLAASLTRLQGRCLARPRMVRPFVAHMKDFYLTPFADAESSSSRRPRTQQYYAPDGNRTTFHHYVPTNGGKVKPMPPVPLTGLSFPMIHCHLSDCSRSS